MRFFYFKHACEHCGADPFWWNVWERTSHVDACRAIAEGLNRETACGQTT